MRILLCAIVFLAAPIFAQDDGVKWERDYVAGLKAAKASNKRMFIDFMAEWCGPCKMLDKKAWPDKDLAAHLKNYVTIKIDIDTDAAVVKKYAITTPPTLLIAEPDESVLVKQAGAPFQNASDGLKWIKEIEAALDQVKALEDAHTRDPKNVENSLKLVDCYSALARLPAQVKLIDEILEMLAKDDKRLPDLKVKLAQLLFEGEVDKERGYKLCSELMDGFLEAKDERAMDVLYGVMGHRWELKEYKQAREAILRCTTAFPKHKRALEYRFNAAYLASLADDKPTAIKEFKAIVEAGPEDNEFVQDAKTMLAALEAGK